MGVGHKRLQPTERAASEGGEIGSLSGFGLLRPTACTTAGFAEESSLFGMPPFNLAAQSIYGPQAYPFMGFSATAAAGSNPSNPSDCQLSAGFHNIFQSTFDSRAPEPSFDLQGLLARMAPLPHYAALWSHAAFGNFTGEAAHQPHDAGWGADAAMHEGAGPEFRTGQDASPMLAHGVGPAARRLSSAGRRSLKASRSMTMSIDVFRVTEALHQAQVCELVV